MPTVQASWETVLHCFATVAFHLAESSSPGCRRCQASAIMVFSRGTRRSTSEGAPPPPGSADLSISAPHCELDSKPAGGGLATCALSLFVARLRCAFLATAVAAARALARPPLPFIWPMKSRLACHCSKSAVFHPAAHPLGSSGRVHSSSLRARVARRRRTACRSRSARITPASSCRCQFSPANGDASRTASRESPTGGFFSQIRRAMPQTFLHPSIAPQPIFCMMAVMRNQWRAATTSPYCCSHPSKNRLSQSPYHWQVFHPA